MWEINDKRKRNEALFDDYDVPKLMDSGKIFFDIMYV